MRFNRRQACSWKR